MANVSDKYARIETQMLVNKLQGFDNVLDLNSTTATRGSGTREYFQIPFRSNQMVGDNEIQPNLMITNSYAGETSLRLDLGFFRLVCSNGMVAGERVYSERVKHIKGRKIEQFVEEFQDKVSIAAHSITEHCDGLRKLVDHNILRFEALDTIVKLKDDKVITQDAAHNAYTIFKYQRPRREEDAAHMDNVYGLWNIINEELRRTATRRTTQASLIERNKKLLDNILTHLPKAA